jgi:hypothetical protein
MDIGFQFEVIYKDIDLLKVRLSAWNGSFGGATDVYVGVGQLEETAAKLKGFPSRPTDTREVTFGAFGPDSAGGAASMRFFCIDASGHACVESKIESDSSLGKPIQTVILSLPIEAAAVNSFVDELHRVGRNRSGKARLEGVLAALSGGPC